MTTPAPPCTDKVSSVSSIIVMVDSGSSGHIFEPCLIQGLSTGMTNYAVLEVPYTIYTSGDHQLDGIGIGEMHGTIKDVPDRKMSINFPAYVVPGLGRNLFSAKAASAKGGTAIFNVVLPRMKVENFVPLQPPDSSTPSR